MLRRPPPIPANSIPHIPSHPLPSCQDDKKTLLCTHNTYTNKQADFCLTPPVLFFVTPPTQPVHHHPPAVSSNPTNQQTKNTKDDEEDHHQGVKVHSEAVSQSLRPSKHPPNKKEISSLNDADSPSRPSPQPPPQPPPPHDTPLSQAPRARSMAGARTPPAAGAANPAEQTGSAASGAAVSSPTTVL